jgi:hypothetical protein
VDACQGRRACGIERRSRRRRRVLNVRHDDPAPAA